MTENNALTPKQQFFVEEYLVDGNATRAAIAAGYSEATARPQASRLLKNPLVAAAIEQRKQDRLERVELDQDWVLRRLMTVVERCMQAEPVLDAKGNKVGAYRFQAAGANRALELLGRHVGLWPADGTVQPPAPDEGALAETDNRNPELSEVIRLFRQRGKA